MSVVERLSERRAEILVRWRELIVESGARRDARLAPRGSDPFHDPIGAALARATAAVLDTLTGAGLDSRGVSLLEEFVRMRAVQGVKPSSTVQLVFALRQAVREVLGADLDRAPAQERQDLDRRIDAIALEVVDMLVSCREKILELRTREVLSGSYLLLKRARLLADDAGDPRPGAREP